MNTVISCQFNIDTASVEVTYANSTQLSIYTPGVDETMDLPLAAQAEVNWLIYNDPITYVNLILSDSLENYAKDMTGVHGLQD